MIVEHTSETPFLFQLGPDGAELTGYAGSEDPVVFVPEQFEGHPVTGIGERAFYQHKEIQRIHLPDTIVHIGGYAFAECRFLEQMDLPDKVASIGDYAFDWCNGLVSVVIGNSVTSIGYHAFVSSCRLTEITSLNTVPPVVSYDTFCGFIYFDSILRVPANSLEAYKLAVEWQRFQNIVSVADGGIDGVEDNVVNVIAKGGKILVEDIDGSVAVEVFNLSGQLVYGGTETTISGLAKGVYIVHIAGQTFKVAL